MVAVQSGIWHSSHTAAVTTDTIRRKKFSAAQTPRQTPTTESRGQQTRPSLTRVKEEKMKEVEKEISKNDGGG